MKLLGLISKIDIWVPHDLRERNFENRHRDPFLKRIVTKGMSILIFCPTIPRLIKVYCDQLNKLSDALKQKRPELINKKV